MENSRFHELKQLFGVKVVESFEKYLGLSKIIGKSKTQVFIFVKEYVLKKLKGWKEKATLGAVERCWLRLLHSFFYYVMFFFTW